MLPRPLRLKRPQDFQAVRRRGQRWRDPLLSIGVLLNDLPYSRYGFVVSKQVGKATTRNTVKRRLREVIRKHLPALKSSYDVVVTAHPPAAEASFQAFDDALIRAFRQLKLTGAVEETT